jgi:hypothetical protein
MFDETNGLTGSWLGDAVNKVIDWKIAQSSTIRWLPQGATGTQVGYGADGLAYQRGQPAPSAPAAALNLSSLLPILLVIGVVLLAVRALK